MNRPAPLDLYRASARALRNRAIYAETAGRARFRRGEIWRYVAMAAGFPLLRALYRLRFSPPDMTGDELAIGSRKRPMYRPVLDGDCPFDDLEYDRVEATWRFMDLRMAATCYGALLRHLPFIALLLMRRPAWSAAHMAVCVVEWAYLRAVIRRHPSVRTVYCGYYVDRKAMLLELVARETGIRTVGMQHGTFNILPYIHRARVDEVILRFTFSAPFARHFFSVASDDDIRVASELFDLGWRPRDGEGRFVVYATSADRREMNRAIVAALDAHLPEDVALLIKRHPRDPSETYADMITGRVGYIDMNATDADAYVGMLSSVMAEANMFGVPHFAMHGTARRDTDFMRSLNGPVHPSPEAMAEAVARSLETRAARGARAGEAVS